MPPSRPSIPPPRTGFRPLLVALMALVLVGSGVGAYLGARQTGMFSLNHIDVDGAPRATAGRIRAALRTPSASTGPGRRASAGSSSHAPSPERPAAESG